MNASFLFKVHFTDGMICWQTVTASTRARAGMTHKFHPRIDRGSVRRSNSVRGRNRAITNKATTVILGVIRDESEVDAVLHDAAMALT